MTTIMTSSPRCLEHDLVPSTKMMMNLLMKAIAVFAVAQNKERQEQGEHERDDCTNE